MNNYISVIVPTKNGGELFRESLEMIFSQEIDSQLEVIIIDSGSTDHTLQICAEYPVNLIQISPSSFNHSTTRNQAIAAAKGEICVLTVQDAIAVDNKWLARLVEPMRQDERVSGVFGQQVSTVGASPMSKYCKLLWYQEWRDDWEHEYKQLPLEPGDWKRLSTEQKRRYARFDNVNSCIRKSVWEKIPFPDVSYAEDIAWAINALSAGFSIFWQPNAKVFHSHERSLAYEFKRSYVDTKIISTLLSESSSLLSHHRARMVIKWLAQEAEQFLQIPVGQRDEKQQSIKSIEEADLLWQGMSEMQEKVEKNGRPVMFFHRWFYRVISGPKWFRDLCRSLVNKGTFLRRKAYGGNSVESAILLELKGRHRFFLNQLLQIHYTQDENNPDTLRVIRFGAAAMVGGSLLGQYMSTVDCYEVSSGTNPHTGQSRSFWKMVEEWYSQKSNGEHDSLLRLDHLLSGGV